jgi:hypothetical protein
MTTPAPFNENLTPHVVLNGQKWPILELAPRQLRQCRRQIIDVTDAIEPEFAEDDPLGLGKPVVGTGVKVLQLPNEVYAQMVDAVYWGLTAAHPDLTEDEFSGWGLKDADLFKAFLTVRSQSGIYQQVTAADAQPGSGEALAT